MARRSKRILGQHERESFLAQAGEWRQACIAMQARAPINEPFYRAVREITDAIDGLAEAVTGKHTHFHLAAHSATPLLRSTFGDHEPPRSREPDEDEPL